MAFSRDTFVPHKNLFTVVRTERQMHFVGFKCTEKVITKSLFSLMMDQVRTLLLHKRNI